MRKAPSSDASYFAPHAWRRVTLACDAMRAGTSHYPYTSSSHDYIRRVPVLYANITNVTKKTEYLGNEELQDVHVVEGFVGLCGLGLFWGCYLLDF